MNYDYRYKTDSELRRIKREADSHPFHNDFRLRWRQEDIVRDVEDELNRRRVEEEQKREAEERRKYEIRREEERRRREWNDAEEERRSEKQDEDCTQEEIE